MKRTKGILLVLGILMMLLVSACLGKNSNRRVSDIPIKTEILGLNLGEISNETQIKMTLQRETGKKLHSESERIGVGSVVRVYSYVLDQIHYGGQSWHYIDVSLDKSDRIVEVRFFGSFEKLEQAKEHFEESVNSLANKYGKRE